MHISLVIVNDIMWFTKQSFPNNSLKPVQLLFIVFRALPNSKVPASKVVRCTNTRKQSRNGLVKRYISKNISESAVSKRSLDDSFFMGFPMVVLANSGTYYNLEQEIKGGVKGKIKHQWSLSSPCSTSPLMLMYSVYSVHQIGVDYLDIHVHVL